MGRWIAKGRVWESSGRVALIKDDNTWEELIIPKMQCGTACYPETEAIFQAREILRKKYNLPEYGKPYFPPGVIGVSFLGMTDYPPEDEQ